MRTAVALVVIICGLGCTPDYLPTSPVLRVPAPPPAPIPDPIPFPSPAVDLTGRYTLTLFASPSCATVIDDVTRQPLPFPSAVLTRQYAANITQRDDGILEVAFLPSGCSGGYYSPSAEICIPIPAELDCKNSLCGRGYVGGRDGREMTYEVHPEHWWEPFTNTERFEAWGTWRASIDDASHITGTVNGTFGYFKAYRDPLRKEADQYCRAPDHRFTLARR